MKSVIFSQAPNFESSSIKNRTYVINRNIHKEVISYILSNSNFFEKENIEKDSLNFLRILYAINSNPSKYSNVIIIAFTDVWRPNKYSKHVDSIYFLLHATVNETITSYSQITELFDNETALPNVSPYLNFDYCFYDRTLSHTFNNIAKYSEFSSRLEKGFIENHLTSGYYFNVYVEKSTDIFKTCRDPLVGVHCDDLDKPTTFYFERVDGSLKLIQLNPDGSIQTNDYILQFLNFFKNLFLNESYSNNNQCNHDRSIYERINSHL